MSDPKNTDDKDIVAKADDEPQVLQDEQLEDADGGFSFSFNTQPVKTFNTKMATVTGNLNTADSVKVNDQLSQDDVNMLRTRPGRFPGGF
ncbi:MAG: hypothetical protein AAGC81_14085 [Pseudomonadota bacterium]